MLTERITSAQRFAMTLPTRQNDPWVRSWRELMTVDSDDRGESFMALQQVSQSCGHA